MAKKGLSQEVDHLVKKFTKGTSYDLKLEEARLQKELAMAKQDIDAINLEIEKNLQNKEKNSHDP